MNIEEIYRQANLALEEKRFPQARELGHQLLKFRFSGAFEILAKAFHGEGNLPVALQVLESGVKEAPEVWPLWLLLGNYRSEAGELEAAITAYRRARSLPGAERDQITLNEALLRLRFGNNERALELLAETVKLTQDKRIRVVAIKHRLTTLVNIDRVTEALLELGEAYLHEEDNAELLSTLAFQLLEKGDQGNALNLARQALGLRRAGEVARVVRLIEGAPSEAANLYQVEFRGQFSDEKSAPFRKTSRVYAESEDEAEALARDFEPPDVRADLTTTSVSLLEEAISERLGVDWSSRLEFEDE